MRKKDSTVITSGALKYPTLDTLREDIPLDFNTWANTSDHPLRLLSKITISP